MLKNGLYNVIGAVIRIIFSLLTIPILIRFIGVEEYGLWTLTTAVVGIVTLAEAGLSISTTVFISRDLAMNNTTGLLQTLTIALSCMLVLATLAAIGLSLSASLIVSFFPYIPPLQQQIAIQAFQLGGVVVWSRLLQQVLVGLEQAYQRYGTMSLLNTIQSTLSNLGIVIIAWQGGRTIAMMQWQVGISMLILVLHGCFGWTLIHQIDNLRPLWSLEKAKEIAVYSGMTWATSLGGILFGQFDKVIVGSLLGTTLLGSYAAISNIAVQINSLSALPVQPLIPDLASLYVSLNGNSHVLYTKIKRATDINSTVALGLGVTLFAITPFLTKFIGIDTINHENVVLLRTAILIYTLYSLNAVGYFILFSINAMKINLIIVLSSGILAIVLITVGAKFTGLSGAILGNAGYILTLLLNIVGLQKLNIKVSHLISWWSFPILWFISVIMIHIATSIFDQQFILSIPILIIELAILCIWFLSTQDINVRQLSKY